VTESDFRVVEYLGSSFGSGSGSARHGSTDPTDIAYNPATGGYFLVDSEVDEAPFGSSINLFALNGEAQLTGGLSLTGVTREPTGIAVWVNAAGGQRLFITDDDTKRVYEVDAANPSILLRSLSTTTFG